MATTAAPDIDRLTHELVRSVGEEPLTARELAARLLCSPYPVALIGALEDALTQAAAAEEDDELDDTLWGPAPTDEQVADARRDAQRSLSEALHAALADSLSRDEAAQRLGITPQAVSKRLATGGLVALSRGREKRLPAWQFYEDAVLPGLPDVIGAYPGGALSLSAWATAPNPDLGDIAPAQALARRGGGVARVLAALEAIGPQAW
jgi:hypothetical protein